MLERSDSVNWSTLQHMRTSPLHYRYALDHPREDTEALLLGRVVHCAVYEPDRMDARYVVMPRFHGGQNDDTAERNGYAGGKQAKRRWLEEHADAEVVPGELYVRAIGMRDALMADPVAAPMIVGGYAEQHIEWVDEATGIKCRGRVDHVNGRLSDLKSTRNIVPRRFAADAVRYGYPSQLAFYADGLAANGIVLEHRPVNIVGESSPPHDVLVLEYDEDDIEAGRRVYRECLDKLAWCRANDCWPGVAGGEAQRIMLPEWAKPAMEAERLTLDGVAIF